MSKLFLIVGISMIYGVYYGSRALWIIFQTIRKLASSRRFVRLPPSEQIRVFIWTPGSNPLFRRFTAMFFCWFAVTLILIGIVLPTMGAAATVSRMPLFIMAGVFGMLGGVIRSIGAGSLAVGAFGWCAGCGSEMQILGLGQLGGVFMDRDEMLFGVGVAQYCCHCGRLYCMSCYPSRGGSCDCDRGRRPTDFDSDIVLRRSLDLIKVQY